MKIEKINKLVIIGNGFDLAHGLETSYKSFMDWYIYTAFQEFREKNYYGDHLIEIKYKSRHSVIRLDSTPTTFLEVLDLKKTFQNLSIIFKSNFLERILNNFNENNWVDIERYYYRTLKSHFSNNSLSLPGKTDAVSILNRDFNFLIEKFTSYLTLVNEKINDIPKLRTNNSENNFSSIFHIASKDYEIKFLNFNYTETLLTKEYAQKEDIIHIHGRVTDKNSNPIIFGYGDESDPTYQNIEDSAENIFLEHIKSFAYFKTNNYRWVLKIHF